MECSPQILGNMIQFDDHIFQMGWFNHQLENDFCDFSRLKKLRETAIVELVIYFPY